MAGRPQRRARQANKNPLLYFSNESTYTASQVRRSDRPVFSKAYATLLKDTYANIPLNLVVLVRSPGIAATPEEYNHVQLKRMAASGDLTILVVVPTPESEDELHPAYGVHTGIPRELLGRGRKNRRTNMTPFTLLHRLGDYAQTRTGVESPNFLKCCQDMHMAAYVAQRPAGRLFEERDNQMLNGELEFDDMTLAAVYCAGVDTAAGRLGLLTDMGNVTADLFAKYLITGKIAYAQEAPEINGVFWRTSREAQAMKIARRQYAEELPAHLKRMAAEARGKVWYF